MDKKGLSNVIVAVLLILVAIAAVVIIWGFIRNSIIDRGVEIETGFSIHSFSVPRESVTIDEDNTNLSLIVKRNSGDREIVAFSVVVYDESGKSQTHKQDYSLQLFESKKISLNYSGLENLNKIEIYPIFLNSRGDEITGRESGSLIISGEIKQSSDPSVPAGYVAYWKFENNFDDETGNNPGSCSGASCPGFSSGIAGQGLEFTDDSQYVNVISSIQGKKNFAVSAWVKYTYPQTEERYFIGKYTSVNDAFLLGTRVSVDGDIGFQLRTGAGITPSTYLTSDFSDGTWHHVLGTVDDSMIYLYVDGNLIASSTNLVSSLTQTTGNSINIGKASLSGVSFRGSIDEVMIYDRFLEESEVKQICSYQKGISC